MKHLHHQFKTRKLCTESFNFTLVTKRSGSCLLPTSTFPTFRASHQRGSTTRFLFLVTYLLTSLGIVCGTCPEKCACDAIYQSIECNDISEVPKNIPNYTRFVSITNTQISEINRSDFFSLSSLRMLSLENNLIGTISSDSFNNSKKLRKLNLNGNRLSTFPEALTGLKKLNEIHLQANDIVSLKPDKPVILQKLTFLDLESNRLTNVTRKFFASMSKMNILKMSFNQIQTIDTDWLRPMTNLETLELESSFAVAPSIGEWFSCESSSSLNSINLAYNDITSIPPRTFTCVPNLTFLILNNNNITELPSNMSLRSVEHLDLGFNHIARLGGDTFQSCDNLTKLGLRSNRLRSLPKGVFRNLNRLEYLDLNYNYLTTIELDTFANLACLTFLNLSGNMLQVIHPRLIYQQLRLRKLDLSHNYIEDLSHEFFQRTTSLKRLSLNNNYLVELPNFRNLGNLQYLDVSCNSLEVLLPNAFDGTSLRTINLGSNRIDTVWLTIKDLIEKETLKKIMINGNPIRCDCMLLRVVEAKVIDSDFTCAWPIRFADQEFLNKDFEEMPPYYLDYFPCFEEVDTAFIQTIIIVWFSILVFVVLVYWLKVYHKHLQLWRAWRPTKRKRKCEMGNRGKPNTYYRIPNDNFWNNNHLFTHRMTSSFRRVRLTESLQSNEYLETIV